MRSYSFLKEVYNSFNNDEAPVYRKRVRKGLEAKPPLYTAQDAINAMEILIKQNME